MIFDRHFDRVHGYLQRQVGPDCAEDLAAQTFLIAFDRRGAFESVHASARPWLFGIAVNLVRRHHRSMRRQLRAYARAGVDPLLDAFDGVDERIDTESIRPELAGALAGLAREELETLLLYQEPGREVEALIDLGTLTLAPMASPQHLWGLTSSLQNCGHNFGFRACELAYLGDFLIPQT